MSATRTPEEHRAQVLEIIVRAAVHHAVEACISATGQRRTIDHFVNKTDIANEVLKAFRDVEKEKSS